MRASNGKFYAMTFQGGSSSAGTLVEFDLATNTLTKKADFTGANGALPPGGLVEAGNGKLYGTTLQGGANNAGTVIEYDFVTNTLTKKADFDAINGAQPISSFLKASNGKLYVLAATGGTNNAGAIVEYDIATNTLTKKADFGGADGIQPYGSLIQASNGKLYGMTSAGGSNNAGTLVEYDIVTNTLTKRADFGGTNGRTPYGSLIQASNGKLYGMTLQGGSNDEGAVVEYDIATSTLTKRADFSLATTGGNPVGSFIQASNGRLYGLTYQGGTALAGTVVEFDFTTFTLTKKADFTGSNGASPIYGNNLVEINQAPVINTSGGGTNANENIAENTTFVVQVAASGSSNTYSISGGIDQGKFTIDASTGVLSFVTAPDFENPTDFGRDNIYIVTVKASSSTGSGEQTIAVSVRNVNEAPSITSNGGGDNSSVSVPENTTAVTTVTATDVDAGTTMKYSKIGGADSARFTIDSTSGALRFRTAPDFENPTDADRNNTYLVVVRASDGTLSDSQAITVTVTDVQESTLPVNLVNVRAAQKATGSIQVEWTTLTETNTERFDVEKSTDGQTFSKIGTVAARGNSTARADYQLLDNQAQAGSNYYRIKTIDQNGTAQYSNVVRVNVGNSNRSITVYPNPVTTNTISLQLGNLERGKYTVTLTNNLGQQLYSSIIEHNGGSSTQTLRINGSFPKGTYQIQVLGDDVRMTMQLIKQ
jgi:uncharacterized repeat protein (TIGR03803 family)